MVLDKLRNAIEKKLVKVREDRAQAKAEENAIRKIAQQKAAAAGRKERVRLATQVAVKKEQAIAQGQLDRFRERRARKTSGGGGGLGFNVITGGATQASQPRASSVVGGTRTRGFDVIDPVTPTRVIAPRTRRKIRKVKKRGKRRLTRAKTVARSEPFSVV